MSQSNQYRDTLHRITQNAQDVMHQIGPLPTCAPGPKLSSHHHLTIHPPQPITSRYIAQGLDSLVAEKLNQAYLDKASSLKQAYENKHRQVLEALQDSGSSVVHNLDQLVLATHTIFHSRYDESLQSWRSEINKKFQTQLVTTRGHSFCTEESGLRPTFKNESVPILEKAFIANAYPSRADKEGLAENTGMEYKQVNIWFQNRRARSKKEGLTLQRTATFTDPLRARRFYTTLPSNPVFQVSFEGENTTHFPEVLVPCNLPNDPFTLISRPAHAFPTPFPPLYDEDPFPARSGTGSFQMPWLRKCVTNPIQRPLADIEQLTARMAGLSLSSDASGSHASPLPSFTYFLPRAPLPSLIRTATASSHARPLTTLVTAAGLSSVSKARESRNLYRTLPARLPRLSIERQSGLQSRSSVVSSRPIQISHSRTSVTGRLRRSETRSPSPPHSRSSSLSSATSHSTSSSRSVASSTGPLTPISTSPRIEMLAFAKDISLPPASFHRHKPLSTFDGVHSSFR